MIDGLTTETTRDTEELGPSRSRFDEVTLSLIAPMILRCACYGAELNEK